MYIYIILNVNYKISRLFRLTTLTIKYSTCKPSTMSCPFHDQCLEISSIVSEQLRLVTVHPEIGFVT